MTWMLVALINEYWQGHLSVDATDNKQDNHRDPLFEELISSWYELELDPKVNAKRVMVAKKLLEIPRKTAGRIEQQEDK